MFLGNAKTSAFDETLQRLGLNVAAPAAKLDMMIAAPVLPGAQASSDITTVGSGWYNDLGGQPAPYDSGPRKWGFIGALKSTAWESVQLSDEGETGITDS